MGTITRFKKKFEISPTGCWLWTDVLNEDGYGRFWFQGKNYRSHRAAYLFFVGAIPDGLCVCHRCDVRNCVNPAHLFLGTPDDNTQDMLKKRRGAQKKLTPEKVLEIRRRHSLGEPKIRIAADFGVSRRLISDVVREKIWKHIK